MWRSIQTKHLNSIILVIAFGAQRMVGLLAKSAIYWLCCRSTAIAQGLFISLDPIVCSPD